MSSLSDKELAQSARDGYAVTFTKSDGAKITGYIAGWDDFHWKVVDHTAAKHLVHKSGTHLTPRPDIKLQEEDERAAIEEIVVPFRDGPVKSMFAGARTDDEEHDGTAEPG